MSNVVEIDTQKVDQMLATLSDPQVVKDIINEGLEAMSQVYYNSILSSLRKEMGTAADTVGIKKGGWYTYKFPLSTGIKIRPDTENTKYGLHALTDFRLKFFEGGTKPRYAKGNKILGYATSKKTGKITFNRLSRSGRGGFRGFITANHFFSNGIDSAEQPAMQALTQSIYNALKNRGIDITP